MSDTSKKEEIPLIDWEEFRGKEIAVIEGKVVASGSSSKKVFEKAEKLFPEKSSKDITLLSVPKQKTFVYII